jgi:hypothetical protein
MSDNIQENKKKIAQLRQFMITQLKISAWTPSGSDGFCNKYLSFVVDNSNNWKFQVYYGTKYDSSSSFEVSDFINPVMFWFLRHFYVKSSLRNHEKLLKEAQLASVSRKFFSKHKDVDRDSKLDQILNSN